MSHRIKAGKKFNPGSTTFVDIAVPSFPSRLLYKSVYVFGKTIDEGVVERAIMIIRNLDFSEVLEVVGVVIDGAVYDHISVCVCCGRVWPYALSSVLLAGFFRL